jgi:probable DNA metabolism protein
MNIYIYDGTLNGFFTVCRRLTGGETDFDIQASGREDPQEGLFDRRLDVATDPAESATMRKLIRERASRSGLETVIRAFLSEIKGIEKDILIYINLVMKEGAGVNSNLADERVMRVFRAAEKTGGEAHRLKGFLRFAEVGTGKFYAKVEPVHNVLSSLALHFSIRMSSQDWIIHDARRGISAFYSGGRIFYKNTGVFEFSGKEGKGCDFESMWRSYFNTMAIRERINPRLQARLVPKKYRKNMAEFSSY